MAKRYRLVCEDEVAGRVGSLARRHGLTESEVLSQLVEIGLESCEEPPRHAD
ncbi:CopG family transcriptional regulator [Natronorarus salvus]|uniref:CopG family transcriptional regulator n=1 Tax=Natronorarus salvus TaxID=3117733 RepID=UPI002F26647B